MAAFFNKHVRLSEQWRLFFYGRWFESWKEIADGLPEEYRKWLWGDSPQLAATATLLLNNKRAAKIFEIFIVLVSWLESALWALLPRPLWNKRMYVKLDEDVIVNVAFGLRWLRMFVGVVKTAAPNYLTREQLEKLLKKEAPMEIVNGFEASYSNESNCTCKYCGQKREKHPWTCSECLQTFTGTMKPAGEPQCACGSPSIAGLCPRVGEDQIRHWFFPTDESLRKEE